MKHYRTKRQKAEDKVQPMTALPEHADTIGLDISRTGFHLSIPAPEPPATWPIWYVDYVAQPNWKRILANLCRPGTVIVAEPTGWHSLAPVASAIRRRTQARLYLVDPRSVARSGKHISAARKPTRPTHAPLHSSPSTSASAGQSEASATTTKSLRIP